MRMLLRNVRGIATPVCALVRDERKLIDIGREAGHFYPVYWTEDGIYYLQRKKGGMDHDEIYGKQAVFSLPYSSGG